MISLSKQISLYPRRASVLRKIDMGVALTSLSATLVYHGLERLRPLHYWELGLISIVAMVWLTVSLSLQYRWSLTRQSFRETNRSYLILSIIWVTGVILVLLLKPWLTRQFDLPESRSLIIIALSQLAVMMRVLIDAVKLTRSAASGEGNPALVLAGSFLILIAVGTILLSLPKARANPIAGSAPLIDALFTATSAGCVTGLTVVDTRTYWSRTGQVIILALFQLGGLGIMTFGSFFALTAGRNLHVRETATLRELLDSDGIRDAKRLLWTIVLVTLATELIGAVLLMGLWDQTLSISERVFLSVFHSVSAFCNAGFTLTENSFTGMATRWQIWGVLAGLIIVGGIGFSVLFNLLRLGKAMLLNMVTHRKPFRQLNHARINLTAVIVLVTTAVLLLGGMVGYFFLESTRPHPGEGFSQQLANAWFQSVTYRTAGFHTTDHGALQPATKLLAILLMFIGASPGSTGGGVKTVCFALAVLAIYSILKKREHVELQHRTISQSQIYRVFTLLAMAVILLMSSTMLLVIFEQRRDLFLEHLYEATSAFCTVGVSTGITPTLTPASKLVLIATMFIGRIGPLTLLIALAGKSQQSRYEYPVERVNLG